MVWGVSTDPVNLCLGFCNHIYDSNWHGHLGNEERADQTVQMYRLSSPLVVRIWHKLVFLREIKTPAHLRHCRDSSEVKSLHLGPAMSPESPAPREPGDINDWCIIHV